MTSNKVELNVRASSLDIEALGTGMPILDGVRSGQDVHLIPKASSQRDCCNVILAALIGDSGPAEFKPNMYTNTFLEILDHRLRRFSCSPIANEITRFASRSDQLPNTEAHLMLVLYQALASVAVELASGATSVENIAGKIVEVRELSTSTYISPKIYQCVFKFISLLTMLYNPADNPSQGQFQLKPSNPGERVRARYQHNSIWHRLEYRITDASVGIDFDHLLAHFGDPIPPRCNPSQEIRRDLYMETLIASNLNFHTISKIGHLRIEWTDVLGCHLELHEPSSTLKLFAFPSFCAMLCSNSNSQETFLSKLFSHGTPADNMQSTAVRSSDQPYCVDFLVEVLNSYRLLFGQHVKSCKYFKSIRPTSPHDALLEIICGSPCYKGESKSFYEWLKVADSKTMYSASTDFPLIGQRLLTLQQYMNSQNPSDLRTLWYDKRDVLRWYTFWAVVIFGGLSLGSGWTSVVLAGIQVLLIKDAKNCFWNYLSQRLIAYHYAFNIPQLY